MPGSVLYGAKHIVRLQQILALKQLGLGLWKGSKVFIVLERFADRITESHFLIGTTEMAENSKENNKEQQKKLKAGL